MTHRIEDWATPEPEPEGGFRKVHPGDAVPVGVTEQMLDEAADKALEGADVNVAHVMRNLWSYDTSSSAAVAFFRSRIEQSVAGRFNSIDRPKLVLPYALDDKAIRDLTAYAPEFTLVFRGDRGHDHSVAAACRKIDQQICVSRLPPGLKFKDLGGSVEYYVDSGVKDFHKCGGLHDPKDPVRSTLLMMGMKKRVQDPAGDAGKKVLAQAVLDRNPQYVCGQAAQDCTHKAAATISVHVYDIKMSDWPTIMENSGALVHEGCIHFSNQFFEESEGELPMSRARYQIDLQNDEFRMGFAGSPAQWYTHQWSELMLYGADQVLYGVDYTYSYKVVERRGDTLFFRILRMDRHLRPERNQVYKLPDVDLVRVKGFRLRRSGDKTVLAYESQEYEFPANLWNHMIKRASSDFERGGLDYHKLFDFYRTIAPYQMINGVCVMGGERVSDEDLGPLVVHAGLYAAAEVICARRTTAALTHAIQVNRELDQETMLFKMWDVFVGSLTAIGYPLVFPILYVGSKMSQAYVNQCKAGMVDWAPVVTLRRISVGLIFGKYRPNYPYHGMAPPDSHREHMKTLEMASLLDVAKHSPQAANDVLKEFADDLPAEYTAALRSVVATQVKETAASDGQSSALPSLASTTVVPSRAAADRLEAIREALVEANVEASNTLSECERSYRAAMSSGEPSESWLRTNREAAFNPDIWEIRQGVLCSSALQQEAADVQHAAIYLPHPDDDKQHLRMLEDRVVDAIVPHEDGSTTVERRRYKVVAGPEYNGYGLVSDATLIFNGPAIVKALQKALTLPHDYVVHVHCGPPGCGKTKSIVDRCRESDVIMCPVRESIRDTRERVADKYGVKPNSLNLWVRTLDSYLVNYVNKSPGKFSGTVLADECYMSAAGRWYAAFALLGVQEVHAYGDPFQIPHIPRAEVSSLHAKLEGDSVDWTFKVYRNPAILVASWAHVYDFKVRTASKTTGYLRRVANTRTAKIPEGCVMMAMYQADKLTLKQMYSQHLDKIKIITSHESEGKTYDHVWLHNFEKRSRSKADQYYLFWKQAHCVVAMSRSRCGVLYCKESKEPDLITEWIANSGDPRRVAAVTDMETVGNPKEFL